MSWLQFGHHVVNFFDLVGASISVRQLRGYGLKIWPMALEEELKVLDYA